MAFNLTTVGGTGTGGGTGGGAARVAIAQGTELALFIADSGSDANDGLTSGTPIQSFDRLNEIINGYFFEKSTSAATTLIRVNVSVGTYTGGYLDLQDLGPGLVTFSTLGLTPVVFTSSLVIYTEAPTRVNVTGVWEFTVEGNAVSTTTTTQTPSSKNPYKFTTTTTTIPIWDIVPKFENAIKHRFTPIEVLHLLRSENSGTTTDKRVSLVLLGSGELRFNRILLSDIASPNTYAPVLLMGDFYVAISTLENSNDGISIIASGDSRIEVGSMNLNRASATSYRYLALIGDGVNFQLLDANFAAGAVASTVEHIFRTTGACNLAVDETKVLPSVSLVDAEYGSNNFTVESIQGGMFEVEYMPTRFSGITQAIPIGWALGKLLYADSGNFVVQTPQPNTDAANAYVGGSFKVFTQGTGFVRIDGFGNTTLHADNLSGTNNVLTTSSGTQLHVTYLDKDNILINVEQGTVTVT